MGSSLRSAAEPNPPSQGVADEERWRSFADKHPGDDLRTRRSLVTAAFLLLFAWLFGQSNLAIVGTNFIGLTVAWIVSVLLHECAHALAARAVGFTPYAMVVGGGPRVVRRMIGGLAADIGFLPGMGVTMFAWTRRSRMRWRLAAIFVAGPIMTSLLLALALTHYRSAPMGLLSPSEAVLFVNFWLLFGAFLPRRKNDPAVPRNDLVQLASLPRLRDGDIEHGIAVRSAIPFLQRMVLGDYPAAECAALRILDQEPDNWVVRASLAEVHLFSESYARAATHYRALLDADGWRAHVAPLTQALVANNYAWALFRLGDPSSLEAADHWSSQALRLRSDQPSILGTRGCVLMAQGNLAEGRALLQQAASRHVQPSSRALNYAYLAIACARAGEIEDAHTFLKRASSADPKCSIIESARREIDERSAANSPA